MNDYILDLLLQGISMQIQTVLQSMETIHFGVSYEIGKFKPLIVFY